MKHILLVEDDLDDQEFFVETAAQVDATALVSVAANGHIALQMLQAAKSLPQLIVLDLNMPVMNGWEFMRLVKTDPIYISYRDIPIAILTTSHSDAGKCYAAGASLYITKPSSAAVFRNIISTLLNNDIAKDATQVRNLLQDTIKA